MTEMFDEFHTLSRSPDPGFQRADLTLRPIRFRVVREYLIACVTEQDSIWILAVLHGRRNPRILAAALRNRA